MKKNILLVFVTALICITGTGYAAYKLQAVQVGFDKSKTDLNGENVQDSIDEIVDLIKYGDATEGDIASGKTALVNGKKITGKLGKSLIKSWKNFRDLELILEVDGLTQVTFDLEMPKVESSDYIKKYPQVLMIDGSNDLNTWTNLYTKKYANATTNAVYKNENCNFKGYKYLKFHSGVYTNSYISADYIYNMVWE